MVVCDARELTRRGFLRLMAWGGIDAPVTDAKAKVA